MKNCIFGYARVSTESQNLDRQLDALKNYDVDKIFCEKITGTKRDRPELNNLLERISAGDTVVIESLSRLGRSTKDLIGLMENFNEKKVNLVSLKESIDTKSTTGKLLFTLISAIAQFERDVIADRTREGLAAARARGRQGGRPKISETKLDKARRLYDSNQYTVKEITEMTGIKRSTFYKHLG
jgi:DNA invertase Pin-like site-specific DNA recombinase